MALGSPRSPSPRYAPTAAAFSTTPSSWNASIDATAEAQASGWPAYVSPPGKNLSRTQSAIVPADDHRAERDVTGVDPLRDGDDVGDDVPVLAGEPAAGAAEAGHHLVEDQQDAVPVADLADRLQVAVGRRDDAVRARHRLEDDRGDGVRPLVLEDLLEVRRARADRARIGVAGRTAVRVRVEHAHDAGHARLDRPAARIAGQRDRAGVAPW